jgi:hypothetical protein
LDRGSRARGANWRRGRWRCRIGARLHSLECDELDALRIAILGDCEIVCGQALHWPALLVRDSDIDDRETRVAAEDRRLLRILRGDKNSNRKRA